MTGDVSKQIDRSTEPLSLDTDRQRVATITVIDPKTPASLELSRWSTLLASPRGVMILVPALVLALGVTLTVIGQAALGATSKTMAKSRFVERTSSVSIRVEEALIY